MKPVADIGRIIFILCLMSAAACLSSMSASDQKNQNRPEVLHNKDKYFEKQQSGDNVQGDYCDARKRTCKDQCQWGYESQCKNRKRYSEPECTNEQGYRVFGSIEEKIDRFWDENDFGYVKKARQLNYLCEPIASEDSSFMCNEALTFCKGRNIFMDFSWNGRSTYERSQANPFHSGQLGGSCKYHPERFNGPNVYKGKLRSWAEMLHSFTSLDFKPSIKENCDITISTPTIVMDLDFVSNMYHHFCDFFNLYATLHANGSLSKDFDIAFWNHYEDRLGPFVDTWKVFTNQNMYHIWKKYEGKKVCFKDLVFSLLPRMAHGLYYSTPLIAGCSKSGIFQAFSHHVLYNLAILQTRKTKAEPIRITLLSRSTKWRRIVNENELIAIMKAVPDVYFTFVDYNRNMPFLDQLKITYNSDIFIGMHGAGLAHALFLPAWALLFELYNTEDANCYKDLARLRGVSYMTWDDRSKLHDETEEPHPQYKYEKFRNFRFDPAEFSRLLGLAIAKVRNNLEKFDF